jgi:hypothetical protein
LNIRYHKYLPLLSDVAATFDASSDRISVEAPWVVIYNSISILAEILEYPEKMQLAQARALAEEERLKRKHFQIRNANLDPHKRI